MSFYFQCNNGGVIHTSCRLAVMPHTYKMRAPLCVINAEIKHFACCVNTTLKTVFKYTRYNTF